MILTRILVLHGPSAPVRFGLLYAHFTLEGSKSTTDGTYPTEHELQGTLEITLDITPWFERVPEDWRWPVGVGLSLEFGYQRAEQRATVRRMAWRTSRRFVFGTEGLPVSKGNLSAAISDND